MSEKSSYQELEQQIIRLERQVARVRRAEKVNKTLFHIATALNTSKTLKDLYGAIHTHLSSLMDMTNFFYRGLLQRQKRHSIRFPQGPGKGSGSQMDSKL